MCGLESGDRDGAIAELIDRLVMCRAVPAGDRDDVLERVLERERKFSTGFGLGVAVPHVKHAGIRRICAAIGLSRDGVDFQSRDSMPVRSIVLLISPEDRPDEHLHAMEALFKQLRKETFRRSLASAENESAVRSLLAEADGDGYVG
ncbi:MAG: PTS sugar transporter subunit IIA [Planctomycetota bacterium]